MEYDKEIEAGTEPAATVGSVTSEALASTTKLYTDHRTGYTLVATIPKELGAVKDMAWFVPTSVLIVVCENGVGSVNTESGEFTKLLSP